MSKYLITLTPMGSFYFGGERSFKVGDSEDDALTSYIIESNLFPQQTSLLGMLRFWILRNSDAFNQAENKISDNEKAKELIGEKGFSIGKKGQFGKIKEIGVCFLQDKAGNNILPTPLDYGLDVDFKKVQKAWYNGKEKVLPEIHYLDRMDRKLDSLFNSKNGLQKAYISTDGKTIFKEDAIFLKDQRIGIDRNIKTGETEESALYKQVFYRLDNGFRFAFTAEFEDGYLLPGSGQIVELGGDSSKFVLEYKLWDNEIAYSEDLTKKPENIFAKVVLLSDTLIDNDTSDFSITETVSFQFLKFDTKTETEYARTSKNNNNKSGRYSLYKRGSVFYFKDERTFNNFKNAIEAKENFIQIGYNIINQ